MASVDFQKLHTATDVKRVIRHCDRDMRMRDTHGNEHIHQSDTRHNAQLKQRDYKTVCNMYDDAINKHDSMPKANKRKDRVTCFALCVPVPDGIQDARAYTVDVYKIICDKYGEDNVLQTYLHVDEVHDYIDAATHDARTSMRHVHCMVMPFDANGKLNGKNFSSKKNMIDVNDRIDEMCRSKYHCKFATGTKKKNRDEVEALKLQSEKVALELEKKRLQEENERLREANARMQQQLEYYKPYIDAAIKRDQQYKQDISDVSALGSTSTRLQSDDPQKNNT